MSGARIKVDLSKSTLRDDRVNGRPLVLLVVCNKMFDGSRHPLGLNTVHVGRGHHSFLK